MNITVDGHLKRLKELQTRFNKSKDPVERYALIQAFNHICETELPIHDWVEDELRKAMLRVQGVEL